VGEISRALEDVWGRHSQGAAILPGVYSAQYGDDARWNSVQRAVEDFEIQQGRRPRLLVAKLGQDGHDRGVRLVATAFADAGFDVDIGPLFQTPAEVARQALENDVHAVGISTQAGGHLTLLPALLSELSELRQESVVICGGIIPAADRPALEEAGVAAIFEPGTPMIHAVEKVLSLLPRRDAATASFVKPAAQQ
jgi:methylmalonyl-CoA mutase